MDQQLSGRGGFLPLLDDDFAELKRLGSIQRRPIEFTPENRAALNEDLVALCRPENDKLAPPAFAVAAEMVSRLERVASSMLATLRELQAMTGQGTRLAVLSLFPMERARRLGESHLTGEALGQPNDMATTISVVTAVSGWANRKTQELSRGNGGRPADEWNRLFVTTVAAAFEAAGGIASASSPNSPFLRVLSAINQRLPAERRTAPDSAPPERAKAILRLRKGVKTS